MAVLEEEGDEGINDEVLLAAVDAALARRGGGIQQQNQQQLHHHHHRILHTPPPLSYTAPQKKPMNTHLSSSASEDVKPHSLPPVVSFANHQYAAGIKKEMVVVAKAPQISSVNNAAQSSHNVQREAKISSGIGTDSKQQGFMKNVVGGTCYWSGPGGPDVKPNGYLKTGGGGIISGGGGRGSDAKQERLPMSGSSAPGACSGRRLLQEPQPWVGSCEIMERPSGSWVQAEKTTCSPKDREVTWFSGLKSVAMFKEGQMAAMRVTDAPSHSSSTPSKRF